MVRAMDALVCTKRPKGVSNGTREDTLECRQTTVSNGTREDTLECRQTTVSNGTREDTLECRQTAIKSFLSTRKHFVRFWWYFLLENTEEISPEYYMHSNICTTINYLSTLQIVFLRHLIYFQHDISVCMFNFP